MQLCPSEKWAILKNPLFLFPGRFHALSYIAKHVNPSRFFELTAQTKETSWTDERLLNGHDSEIFIRESVTRSIKRFDNSAKKESVTGIEKSCNIADKSESFEKYQDQVDKVKSLLSEARKPIRFMRDITTGKEPMAVLCHGDFCRNNILFQYNVSLFCNWLLRVFRLLACEVFRSIWTTFEEHRASGSLKYIVELSL